MGSPDTPGATSDVEPPSSPNFNESKSFLNRGTIDDDDSHLADATPEPSEKPGRGGRSKGGGGGGGGGGAKDANAANSAGKIKHLKKEDGEPLWRKDIQFDLLKAIFENDLEVFTNSYEDGVPKQTFADLYIDTMSRSSKTSKVLRDKLLSDREAAKNMAMVCLLVNAGRMNTTLNFFPEMRAQLRTYHAIPSLQAQQDPHAYKQLQDAPRLKSILKGGSEDRGEPQALTKLRGLQVPRTNPVNLIFIMTQAASKVADLHFPPNMEFNDLIMKTQYTSASRARAFLWLMWFYLESDFTQEGCEENPFGAGVDYGLDVANQGIPELEEMSPEQEALENVDTQEEIDFGRAKQKTRAKILEADQQYLIDRDNKRGSRQRLMAEDGPAILPRIRPSKNESDMDSTRSTPPPRTMGRGTGGNRRGAALKYQVFEGSSPAGGHGNNPVIEGIVARKPRPPTAHQIAVERNRSQRVEYLLDRGIRKEHHRARKIRRRQGAIYRAWRRIQADTNSLEDSEEEGFVHRNVVVNGEKEPTFREKGVKGLSLLASEEDDFGEEVASYAAAIRRCSRRLARWEQHKGSDLGVIAPVKRPKAKRDEDQDETQDGYLNGLGPDGDTMDLDDEMRLPTANGANGASHLDEGDDDDPDRTGIAPTSPAAADAEEADEADLDDAERVDVSMADVDSDID